MPPPDHFDTPWRGLPPRDSRGFRFQVVKVRAGIPKLSPTQAAVALGLWQGLTEQQIAEWLGLTKATVHQHHGEVNKRIGDGGRVRTSDVVLAVERAIQASGPPPGESE